jgi:hypothetical protein
MTGWWSWTGLGLAAWVGDGVRSGVAVGVVVAVRGGGWGSRVSGMLGLEGSVPWEWLAACRTCNRPHSYRPDLVHLGCMTWAAVEDGHTYRPRLGRWNVDALMVEHRSETGQ